MINHKESRIVNYTQEQMFDLVADVEKYPQFLPWCTSCRIISKDIDGNFIAEMGAGVRRFSGKFKSQVVIDRPNFIEVKYISGALSSLTNYWRFYSHGDEKDLCKVEFSVSFKFKNPLLQIASRALFDEVKNTMMKAFEKRAKEIYGHPQKS